MTGTMNAETYDNDNVLFDRLVDGELSVDERRRLLASLDDRVDGWRRCAAAFLEAQSWSREMRRIVEPSTCRANDLVRAREGVLTKDRAESSWRQPTRSPASWLSSLAIAAGLMVAYGLGWQMNGPASTGDANLVVQAPPSSAKEDGAARLPDDDAITLVVQDRAGHPRRVQIPLVEGHRLGDEFADAPQWAVPVVRREFAKQGLDLQARRRYAPLFFEQADRVVPMIVPVDDAVITPVSRPIF
jgi:hypothetical protein